MAQFDTWTGRTLGEPTVEQWEALKAYAEVNGRYWKQSLRDAWMTGDYGSFAEAGLLQQIRNTFGPRWLNLVDIKGER